MDGNNVGNVGLDAKKRRCKRQSEHYSVGGVRFTNILEFKLEDISIVYANRWSCESAVNALISILNIAA